MLEQIRNQLYNFRKASFKEPNNGYLSFMIQFLKKKYESEILKVKEE